VGVNPKELTIGHSF